jgi:stage II sporulation protein D
MSSASSVRRRFLGLLLAGPLLAAGCLGPTRPPAAGGVTSGGVAVPATVRIRVVDRVQQIPLETYVVGTVLSEFSPIGEAPAAAQRILEVQSVIARTYATAHLGRHRVEGFDLCDTTHCQVYQPSRVTTSRFSAAAQAAGRKTAGRILVFGERPAQTLFHADCGGHTADATDVWGGASLPYLRGDADDVPAGTHRQWQFAVDGEALRAALNADPRSAVGRTLRGVRVASRDDSGRAAELELDGEMPRRIRGDALRAIMNRAFGVQSVMSTRMAVIQDRAGEQYRFAGTGFGHGVGLCQVGAAARARRGDSLERILAAYYPGGRLP